MSPFPSPTPYSIPPPLSPRSALTLLGQTVNYRAQVLIGSLLTNQNAWISSATRGQHGVRSHVMRLEYFMGRTPATKIIIVAFLAMLLPDIFQYDVVSTDTSAKGAIKSISDFFSVFVPGMFCSIKSQ